MKDQHPPPTPFIRKGGKDKRPMFFCDDYNRIRIDSIASYNRFGSEKIQVVHKSGHISELDFDVEYLCNLAISKLDAYFNVDRPDADACSVCTRKDKHMPAPDQKRKWCTGCYSDREKFHPPEAS